MAEALLGSKQDSKKIYVSGKFANRTVIRDAMKTLQNRNHSITHDWTQHSSAPNKTLEELRSDALADMHGIEEADIVIVIIDDPYYPYKGTMFEAGYACGLQKAVYIVTQYQDLVETLLGKVCFVHVIKHVKTLAECIAHFEGRRV